MVTFFAVAVLTYDMPLFSVVAKRFTPSAFANYAAHVPLGEWRGLAQDNMGFASPFPPIGIFWGVSEKVAPGGRGAWTKRYC